jgi:PBP1b-binding outer membrane lipoprotein LpoB
MKRILYLLTLVFIFSGCNNKNNFSVDGVIKNTKQKYIYLNRLDVNTTVFIDSVKIGRSGSIKLKTKASGPEFYQLGFQLQIL